MALLWRLSSLSIVLLVLQTLGSAQDDYVAYWPFNEGTGLIASDASATELHAEIFGADWADGVQGSGLDFFPNDFVRALEFAPEISSLNEGSISVWFKLDPIGSDAILRPIFYLGSNVATPRNGLVIEVGHGFVGSTLLYLTIYNNSATPVCCFDTAVNLPTGVWHHFVAVVGAGFNTGYLNGTELVDRNYNFGGPTDDYFFDSVVGANRLWIGKGHDRLPPDPQHFEGMIDEVRIYDRPLLAGEIATYYTSVTESVFVRGDANADGAFDVADAVFTLSLLFAPATPAASCEDSADSNDDGNIDVADAIYSLSSLFAAGAPNPPEPFPACGVETTIDTLECAFYPSCF